MKVHGFDGAVLAAPPPRRLRLSARTRDEGSPTAEFTPPARFAIDVATVAILMVEVVGSLLMWAPIPLAWMWVGARVFDATNSLAADAGIAFAGFVASTIAVMVALNRLDGVWIALRRRTGRDQKEGALNRVVIGSATLGLIGFFLWWYFLDRAFIMPFMPTQ